MRSNHSITALILLAGMLAPWLLSGMTAGVARHTNQWPLSVYAALGVLGVVGFLFGRRVRRTSGMFLFGGVAAIGFVPVLLPDLGAVALIILSSGVLTSVAAFVGRRLVWLDSGCCLSCGYDLRGCVAPRCSECGAPFDPRTLGPQRNSEDDARS